MSDEEIRLVVFQTVLNSHAKWSDDNVLPFVDAVAKWVVSGKLPEKPIADKAA